MAKIQASSQGCASSVSNGERGISKGGRFPTCPCYLSSVRAESLLEKCAEGIYELENNLTAILRTICHVFGCLKVCDMSLASWLRFLTSKEYYIMNSSNLEIIKEPKWICCWNRCAVLSCESSWEHGDLCLGNSWTRKTQNDPMNCWLGVLPWMISEIAVLVEGRAQKSQWWEVMTFCPGCTENVWCNRWVYCWRVGNSNTNCNDFIHDVCIKCSRYIYLFFSLLWSSSDTRTANSECCPFRHLAMNLSIERITEGFTNESHLGSVSSHDLISRDSSG